MRKTVLALAAAGSVFAMTAAGAASFTLTNAANQGKYAVASTGDGVSVTSAICTDPYALSYTVESGAITAVSLDNTAQTPSDSCKGAAFVVKINGSTEFSGTLDATTADGTETGSYTLVDGSKSVAVDITPGTPA